MCKKFYKGKETVLDQSESEVAQSCPTLCDPIDCSLLGSSVHGIFQAIVLEWMDISFSRDLPNPGLEPKSPTLQVDSLPSEPPGKPCCPRNSQESSQAPQFESISSSVLSLLYSPTLTYIHNYWKTRSFAFMDLCRQSDVCFLIRCLGLL